MIIAGIDPGKTGALVILNPDDSGMVLRVPLIKAPKEMPAFSAWATTWRNTLAFEMPELIVVELVSARPNQGVTSMFTFGKSYGFALALAYSCGARIEYVTPAKWKSAMKLNAGADKNASRELVARTLPKLAHEVTRVKDDGVAEAALLALYGRRFLL